ncbi:MAG: two-component system sensor histidine kinase PhoR, partial [Enterobacterales bacterium]|nr:two-component system sensor histidine kinase PhoR [Enterobacterales bacterium]
ALNHHEATLNIMSEIGLGTRFVFTLPPHLIVPLAGESMTQKNKGQKGLPSKEI